MALIPKDATFQIRLPADLMQAFREGCEKRDVAASALVRRWIREQVDGWLRAEARAESARAGGYGEPPAEAPAPPAQSQSAPPQLSAVDDDDDGDASSQPMSRAERRRLERDQKKGRA